MNSHAVFGASSQTPRSSPGAGRSSASAASNSPADPVESTTSAARCSKCARPAPAVKHRSARAVSGCALNQSRYSPAICTNAAGCSRRTQRKYVEPALTGRPDGGRWYRGPTRPVGCFLEDDVRVGSGEPE
ncbi:hypothetical protein N602_29920 [Mycobacterium avium subsp. hominissuis 10-5606]|nr:hypothetical protein N602_29920 [Mycobacterium avium subsp. hominissuis 10-5606]